MDAMLENGCISIFASKESEIREKFTELWLQVINEKENNINNDVQANIL